MAGNRYLCCAEFMEMTRPGLRPGADLQGAQPEATCVSAETPHPRAHAHSQLGTPAAQMSARSSCQVLARRQEGDGPEHPALAGSQ